MKKIIKSAVSITTVAAILSSLVSCSMSKNTPVIYNGAAETVIAEKDTLTLEYEEAYDAFCNISSSIKSGSRQDTVKYAELMLNELEDVGKELNADYSEVHAVIDSLGNSVINDRQKSYENEMNSKLESAKNAARLLIEDESAENEGLEILDELFSEPEKEFLPTAEPSISTKTDINSEVTLDTLTFEEIRVYSAPTDADLSFNVETEMTDEMKAVADSLGTAKNVYEYVTNNIKFEPYYGSRKGAKGTFEQCGGNDTDTASLLIAMLRYLGIPAHYASGTVYITPEQAIMMTGASDADNAGRLLASQYKPVTIVTENGKLTGFQMVQTWVEAYVPYTDYRAAGNNSGDSVWVSLDPSFKELKVAENTFDTADTDTVKYLDEKLSEIDENYKSSDKLTIFTREIAQLSEKYLPLSLPYQVVSTDSTFTAVQSSMSDSISVDVGWDNLFSLSTAELYGKSITICYEGETDYDQQLIESYGGVEFTPAYLVNVVPTAIVGEKVYQGSWGVPLGTAQQMTTYVRNRSGTSVLADEVNAGSVYAINLDLQIISSQDVDRSKARLEKASDNAEKYGAYSGKALGPILDLAGKSYFVACDTSALNAEFASDVNRNRMLALAFTGYNMKPETFFGYTQKLHYGNFYIDVAYNSVTAVSYSGNRDDEISYLLTQGASESAYEGEVWEAFLGQDCFGISTMSMFAVANALDIERIIITSADVEEQLAQCNISDMTKKDVRNFINRGYIVEIIPEDIQVNKWDGTAYIAYDLNTGSAAYMLSGGTAGGSSSKDVKLAKPSASNLSVDAAMDICYQINMIIYMLNITSAITDLAEAAANLSIASTSPLAAVAAGIPAINAAKSIGEAYVMFYDNIQLYVDYAVEGSNEAAMKMIKFTIKNINDLVKGLLEELLPETTLILRGVEFDFADIKDLVSNVFDFFSGDDD